MKTLLLTIALLVPSFSFTESKQILRAYSVILNSSYEWTDSLLDANSTLFQNLSTSITKSVEEKYSTKASFGTISFQRSLRVRFRLFNGTEEELNTTTLSKMVEVYRNKSRGKVSVFYGPPRHDGLYYHTLRFPLLSSLNHTSSEYANVSNYMQHLIDCFYQELGIKFCVQEIAYGNVCMNFAAIQGAWTNRTDNHFSEPPLPRLICKNWTTTTATAAETTTTAAGTTKTTPATATTTTAEAETTTTGAETTIITPAAATTTTEGGSITSKTKSSATTKDTATSKLSHENPTSTGVTEQSTQKATTLETSDISTTRSKSKEATGKTTTQQQLLSSTRATFGENLTLTQSTDSQATSMPPLKRKTTTNEPTTSPSEKSATVQSTNSQVTTTLEATKSAGRTETMVGITTVDPWNQVNLSEPTNESFSDLVQHIDSLQKLSPPPSGARKNVLNFLTSSSKAMKQSSKMIKMTTLDTVTSIVSSMLSTSPDSEEEHWAPSLIQILQNYVSLVDIENESSVSIQMNAACLTITDVNAIRDVDIDVSIEETKVHIPKESFPIGNKTYRITIIALKNTASFGSTENLGMVVAVKIGEEKISNLRNRIKIEFTGAEVPARRELLPDSLKENRTTVECKYYDEQTNQWQTDGCYLDATKTQPTCEVNHLTNFAIIVNSKLANQDVALSIVSKIGCILSILGLTITIVLYIHSKKWKRNRPALEMLHVCFNLILAYIIFLAGVAPSDNRGQCIATTATLQYFYLATWLWIGIYTRDMYISLVKVYAEQPTNYLAKATCVAYCVPFVIVIFHASITTAHFDNLDSNTIALTEGLEYKESTYYGENVCWLHGYSLYFGFLLPVGIIFTHNLICFGVIVYEIAWKADSIDSSAKKQTALSKLKLAVVIGALVGLTWTFAFFLFLSEDELYSQIMSWLFALLNSTQGFTMFLLLCVRSKDIRKTWWDPLRRKLRPLTTHSASRSAMTSTSSEVTENTTWRRRQSSLSVVNKAAVTEETSLSHLKKSENTNNECVIKVTSPDGDDVKEVTAQQ